MTAAALALVLAAIKRARETTKADYVLWSES